MGKTTDIGWTEATWNPWHGCKKVSSGCKYCYMYRDKERWKQDPTKVVRSDKGFRIPIYWKEPKLIFTCSWSDWFIEEADEWREAAWSLIRETPHHTYQILTKRPERIMDHLPPDWGEGYKNVWLGVSAENQERANERIPILMDIPAMVRFVSFEPLLGKIDLKQIPVKVKDTEHLTNPLFAIPAIHWTIIGGESGNENGKYKYRRCDIDWLEGLVDQCTAEDVPVFVKQLGTYLAKKGGLKSRHGSYINEFPDKLQIQQMPKAHELNIYL